MHKIALEMKQEKILLRDKKRRPQYPFQSAAAFRYGTEPLRSTGNILYKIMLTRLTKIARRYYNCPEADAAWTRTGPITGDPHGGILIIISRGSLFLNGGSGGD